jgi:hypothetical protein
MTAIEMSPNSYLLLDNCIVVTFYLGSLRLMYRYDTIVLFHKDIGIKIKHDLDYGDVVELMVDLKQIERKAKTWITNNSNEYNTIQNPVDQDSVVEKMFPDKDKNEIYTRWQSSIINLIYYNLTINDVIKQSGYYISKRENEFNIHKLVGEQYEAFFKCPPCKQTIDKESTYNIFECDSCCQRYCSESCKISDVYLKTKINHDCELKRKYQFLKDIVCTEHSNEIHYQEDFPVIKGTTRAIDYEDVTPIKGPQNINSSNSSTI